MFKVLLCTLITYLVSVLSSGENNASYFKLYGPKTESVCSFMCETQKGATDALVALYDTLTSSTEGPEDTTERPSVEAAMTYGDRGCFVIDNHGICVPMWADFFHYNTPGNGLCQEWHGHRMLAGHVQNDNWRDLYNVKVGDTAHLYFEDGSYISFAATKSGLANSHEMRLYDEDESWYKHYKWISATCAGDGKHWYVAWEEIETVGQRASEVSNDATSVTRH